MHYSGCHKYVPNQHGSTRRHAGLDPASRDRFGAYWIVLETQEAWFQTKSAGLPPSLRYGGQVAGMTSEA